jgi:hypothetical protein
MYISELQQQQQRLDQIAAIGADLRRILDDDRRRKLAMDADRHLSPTAQRLRGALFTYLGPRLAADERMPDLASAVAGVDRGNVRRSRRTIADSIRRLTRGKLARDADVMDLEELLEQLERAEGEDEEEPEIVDDPWSEARDRGRRRAEDDPPDFPGSPRTGGSMTAQENEHYNDTRFPRSGEPADARDRLPHRARRPRRFGAMDSASFTSRFPFVSHVRAE